MKEINIAELLKDCPKGMELYSSLCGECKLDLVIQSIIHVRTNSNKSIAFYPNGRYIQDGECVLFPSKENRDWSTFQRPFKDGDILVGKCNQPFIFKKLNNYDGCFSYCGIDSGKRFLLSSDDWTFANSLRFATEEEKQKLFDAIKANGYKWNAETKTLEKLIVPKFKVGDKVRVKNEVSSFRIIDGVFDTFYSLQMIGKIDFTDQDNWELVPNKFDITTLNPFDKVLVRDINEQCWHATFYSHPTGTYYSHPTGTYFYTTNGLYAQCIPFEDNKHLLGTKDDCDEYYKTWE